MWSILWNRFDIWKRFRLFSTRGSYTLPIRPHDGRSGIVPPWYATHCGSISGDWRSKLKKNATEGAIQGSRTRPMNRWLGKRRRRGQQNNPRGRSTLPVCSARQEKARGCAHSGQRNCLFVDRHCRPYHIHDSKRAVRSSFESRGWYEKAVRREPTQCGYCFSGSIGEAGRPPEFLANERNLCGITLLSRLRSRPILANAAFISPCRIPKAWRLDRRDLRPLASWSRTEKFEIPSALIWYLSLRSQKAILSLPQLFRMYRKSN